ncbi:hypothetical protein ACIPPJ_14820 [Streptomyces sp. NPDC086091]
MSAALTAALATYVFVGLGHRRVVVDPVVRLLEKTAQLAFLRREVLFPG